MLVVAIAEKSQRNRFMLEWRARQRYHKLKTGGLVSLLGRCQFSFLFKMPVPPMRLPHDALDTVACYVSALDELALKRVQREIKVAQWLAYHRLFACGAVLSAGMMDCSLVGFHKTITVDRAVYGPPNYHRLEYDLYAGAYLRLYWALSYEYDAEGRVTSHGSWRLTNYLSAESNPHHDVGFLNLTEVDNGVNYDEVVVCVYSKLPTVSPFFHDYHKQYDVVIMGRSRWYTHNYDEWDELYWPFTRMVIEQRAMEPDSGEEESDDEEFLFSDSDNSSVIVMAREELAVDNSGGGSDDESLFSDNS